MELPFLFQLQATMSSSSSFLTTALFTAVITIFFSLIARSRRSHTRLPPTPPAWPIIGHLKLLAALPHRSLAQLSLHYGPIFGLRLGTKPAVVVSSAALAKEFLNTHDKVFAFRPRLQVGKRMAYDGKSIFFMQYGPRWRQIRKVCATELFTAKRLESFTHIRLEEISSMLLEIENLSQRGQLAVDFSKFASTLAANIMGRVMLGTKLFGSGTEGADLRDLVHEMSLLAGTPVIGDFIPFLGWLDGPSKARMDRVHERMDVFLEYILAERHRRRETMKGEAPSDFLDVLISADDSGLVNNESVKGTFWDMLAAGIDTTAVTLEWAMAELLRNPEKLQNLQEELQSVLGEQRDAKDSHLPDLTYLHAVIKETFRLHPPAPLLFPHASMQECKAAGYLLPKDTIVLVNVWAIGRDPSCWVNPNEFIPERFVGSSIDVRGQHFELLPFGAGRRACPGMPLGMSVVELTLANLVHRFDWCLPEGSTGDLDMTEKHGNTIAKALPLMAVPKPREVVV